MSNPERCYECGGKVLPVAEAGRTIRHDNTAAVLVPADLAIPTCVACGEMFFDEKLDAQLDAALKSG